MSPEALGLSIHPTNPEQSPELGNSAAAGSSKRLSQPRNSLGGGPAPASQLGQEIMRAETPPSPGRTPSPRHPNLGFTLPPPQQLPTNPTDSPQLIQMSPQGLNYTWNESPQARTSVEMPRTTAAPTQRTSDPWVSPDAAGSKPAAARHKKQASLDTASDVVQLQYSPDRNGGRWGQQAPTSNGSGGPGSLTEAMAQRTSPPQIPTQPKQSQMAGVNPTYGRPRPSQTSSSPVMVQAILRQASMQQHSPPTMAHQGPSYNAPTATASSSMPPPSRHTPPSNLHGLIPPNVNPAIPILGRSNTENANSSAVAAGVRPIQTPPGGYSNNGRRDNNSPNMNYGVTSTSPPYRNAPMNMNSGGDRTNYNSAASSDVYGRPFEYDQDTDDGLGPRRQASPDYRFRQSSPPPIPARGSNFNSPPTSGQTVPQTSPQTQPHQQPALRPSLAQNFANSGTSSNPGSQFRVPRVFPVHEELDDDVAPTAKAQQPAPQPHQKQPQPQPEHPPQTQQRQQQTQQQQHPQHYPQQQNRYYQQQPQQSQSKERRESTTPPPPDPHPHPPIPLHYPQSISAAQPPVLRHGRHESTPSPPAPSPLRVEIGKDDEIDPAQESSDHHTPKSPNAPLPADYGYSYPNTNAGRYGSRLPPPAEYGGLHHQLFAMQMSGMPIPRGPIANFGGYAPRRDSFNSLTGLATALKSDSPYPAPPPPANNSSSSSNSSKVNGSTTAVTGGGYDTPAGSGPGMYGSPNMYEAPWDASDIATYNDFVEFQRRAYNAPGTPQYTGPQHSQQNQGSGERNSGPQGTQTVPGHNSHYSVPAYGNGYGPGGSFEPSMIPERYIPSALSSYLSSPMMHNPFLPRFPPPASLVSSPSHIPLDLPPAPVGGRRLTKKRSKKQLRGASSGGTAKPSVSAVRVPSKLSQPPQTPQDELIPERIGAESTVPRDSSSEDSDTDDTKKGSANGEKKKGSATGQSNGSGWNETSEEEDEDDDDVWLEEDSEDELDSEYHSRYIQNPSKRKRKWEQKWDAMIRLVGLVLVM